MYATDLETITLNTLEAGGQREIQLAVKEWRALKGCFELRVEPDSLRVENVSENEKALFISISKVLGLPFQVDEIQQLKMPCQSGQEFYVVLSLLLSLNPSRVFWSHLDMMLTYVPNRVIGALLKALGDKDSDVRKAAAGALGQLKQATCASHRRAPQGIGGDLIISMMMSALPPRRALVQFQRYSAICHRRAPQCLGASERSNERHAATGVLGQLKQAIQCQSLMHSSRHWGMKIMMSAKPPRVRWYSWVKKVLLSSTGSSMP